LPRQSSFQKVDQYKPKALEIVPAALLYADMRVKTSVPSSTREAFPVLVGNVLAGLRVSVLLRETKINYVNVVLPFTQAHQKVIWLDIPVQV
jgi:hypothetical protein